MQLVVLAVNWLRKSASLLRDLCRDHPSVRHFLRSCLVAVNDEAQQGGQAGSTILATYLGIRCLQIRTGDKETRSGTGGSASLARLALKSVSSPVIAANTNCPFSLEVWSRKLSSSRSWMCFKVMFCFV